MSEKKEKVISSSSDLAVVIVLMLSVVLLWHILMPASWAWLNWWQLLGVLILDGGFVFIAGLAIADEQEKAKAQKAREDA